MLISAVLTFVSFSFRFGFHRDRVGRQTNPHRLLIAASRHRRNDLYLQQRRSAVSNRAGDTIIIAIGRFISTKGSLDPLSSPNEARCKIRVNPLFAR
jgi:hypothetical protein